MIDPKEAFIRAHEEEVDEYMEQHPGVSWDEAYRLTSDRAYDRMVDRLADAADHAHTQRKETPDD